MLVVDDERSYRDLLETAFGLHEVEVVAAPNGQAALSAIAARGSDPLLVLSDVLMPVMDGFTLARRLRDGARRTLLVLMSGSATDQSAWPADLREVPFMTKPFRLDRLTAWLGEARRRREAA